MLAEDKQVIYDCQLSPSELRGVCGEEGGHLSLPEPRHHEADPRHPLVKVGGDARREIVIRLCLDAEVSQELGDHEAEDDDVIDLDICLGRPDAGRGKELLLELVHLVRRGADIEQDHLGVAVHQPSAAHNLIPEKIRSN